MSEKLVGQHWLEVAAGRVRAGEPEEQVMQDYGYTYRRAQEPQGAVVESNNICDYCETLPKCDDCRIGMYNGFKGRKLSVR